jgi:hypothetical protein
VKGLGYFPGKFRERIDVLLSLGVSFDCFVSFAVAVDPDLWLKVTDFLRLIVPGVLRMPPFDGLGGVSGEGRLI